MPSFKVPCPSCEAPVLIKDPKLVGTKVECPKCKYRFKVEEPAADPAADAKKGDAKDKKADAKKTKAAGGKNKKLVPILVGVGAVVILAVVGIVAFGGGKKPSPGGPGGPDGPGVVKGPGDPEDPGVTPPNKVDPGPPPVPFSTKNTTNLLPGQSVAVYRFNMDRVRESPAHSALADAPLRKLFLDSMGFEMDEVEAYFHCVAGGDARDAFGIVKLKTPAKPADVTARLMLQPKPKAVKGRDLHAVRSNPFAGALSHALAMRSILGEVYDRVPGTAPAPTSARPMGLCVYDTQHILLGDYGFVEKFLGELDADGYPPFKTVMNSPTVAPPTGMPPDAPPAMPPAPPAPPPAPPSAGDRPFTSIDTYRTIEPPLKRALDALEADKTTTPLLVYAEKFDARQYDPKLIKKDYQLLKDALDPIAARTLYLSANVVTFTQRQLIANLRITLQTIDDARDLAKDQLGPGLAGVAELLKLYLTVPVEFRDYTKGGTVSDPMGIPGGSEMPFGPGGMLPGPGGRFPGPGGMVPGPAALGPGAFPGPGGPPGPGMPPGPGVFPGPGMQPGGEGGMMPGGVEDPNQMRPPSVAHIDLGMTDNQLLIAIDLSWTESVYRATVAPRLVSVTNQIKGKMAVYGAEYSWHALAAAGPKALAERKAFPRGTADRRTNIDRFGLAYPPSSRVSVFAELLPYMGRKGLADSLRKDLAWYDEKNLPAPGNDRAGAWVPELLVPDYPQSAWRATSPLAPDHVLGATNYVAIAGVGLNIAREDPANSSYPDFKKRAGLTGYGWGSKAEEVTDGLSNTIYMMQTPPGLQQPWIAGGGATVRGFDETDPMGAFKWPQSGRAKPGSYALMGDGSVRFIPADIDPKILLALSTRAGGEALADLNTAAPGVEAPKVAVPEAKKAEEKTGDKKEPDPKDKKPDAKTEDKDKKPADPKDKKEPEAPKGKEPAKVEPAPSPTEKK